MEVAQSVEFPYGKGHGVCTNALCIDKRPYDNMTLTFRRVMMYLLCGKQYQ
jgi:hypothetical protein